MTRSINLRFLLGFTALLLMTVSTRAVVAQAPESPMGGPFGLAELSEETRQCIECHKKDNHALYEMWGDSRHHRANVGCFECHAANKSDPDALLHYDQYISVIVSPKDCARCHSREVKEFNGSLHALAGDIKGSTDWYLAHFVEGGKPLVTSGFPQGNSPAAVTGCWQCHGAPIKVLPDGRLDPATWPNAGIGRINPDGSTGSCTACHSRHTFSAAEARHPATCAKCHAGPDHPQKTIYADSKHGIAFAAHREAMHLDANKWILGEDYAAAPTCATCHMSATQNQPVTHNVGLRISWNNRPAVSVHTDVVDRNLGLPSRNVAWQDRRTNMKDVCINCHNKTWIDNYYTQYDAVIALYNEKYAKPGLELYELAQPLLNDGQFRNRLDYIWYEIWHGAGRRARHGAAMMNPELAQHRGMHELAEVWYNRFVPELQRVITQGKQSDDTQIVTSAEALESRLNSVLNRPEHKWYLGYINTAQRAQHKKDAEQFEQRYAPEQ